MNEKSSKNARLVSGIVLGVVLLGVGMLIVVNPDPNVKSVAQGLMSSGFTIWAVAVWQRLVGPVA
jgi:hypothetical protein